MRCDNCPLCPIAEDDVCPIAESECGIQQAFDRLAAYEDSGLSPAEIFALKADNERLHELLNVFESIVVR